MLKNVLEHLPLLTKASDNVLAQLSVRFFNSVMLIILLNQLSSTKFSIFSLWQHGRGKYMLQQL